jgi:hypothetical protein
MVTVSCIRRQPWRRPQWQTDLDVLARLRSAAAPQDLDILLEGSRGYRFALFQQKNATTGEIETIVAGMRDQSEVLEL